MVSLLAVLNNKMFQYAQLFVAFLYSYYRAKGPACPMTQSKTKAYTGDRKRYIRRKAQGQTATISRTPAFTTNSHSMASLGHFPAQKTMYPRDAFTFSAVIRKKLISVSHATLKILEKFSPNMLYTKTANDE